MHGIAGDVCVELEDSVALMAQVPQLKVTIAILKYGYLDDNTALRRYSASCGPDHDSQMSNKKKK